MCMIDDGDGCVTMIRDGVHTARKQHKCAECRRNIEPGERYMYEFFRFDGKQTAHKTCAHCRVARGWLNDECGGFLYGQIEEDMQDHAYSHGWAVARMYVGMKTYWRRRDGSLRPIPVCPPTTHERMKITQLALPRGRV